MSFSQKIIRKLRTSWTPRSLLLFVLPLPLIPAMLVSLIKGDLSQTIVYLSAITLFLGGAILLRRGLVRGAEHSYRSFATTYKRSTQVPIKTLGAVAVSLGTTVCSYFAVQHSLVFSTMLGMLTFLGVYLSYGLDPKREKPTVKGGYGLTPNEIMDVLLQAEQKIEAIEQAGRHVGNKELSVRLQRISALAREVLLMLEEDPGDLHRARKFLYVYLDGAQKVSAGYARAHGQTLATELENNFREVLITIEEVFIEQQKQLIDNNIVDLDVQIEVLSTQLKREGIL
ncbi:MAG: 5-bromo-4-chloroindolyl phosphate hydrolase [Gammaproteobacteria bacterium]|nr:5-bromo-4-chloroindolyl phosphate hydrolase [Gammaproteobacteria bacterium]